MGICFFLTDNLHDVLRLIVAGHKRCFVDEQPAFVSPVKFPSLESRDKQVAEFAFQTS